MATVRVAGVQMDIRLGDTDFNVRRMIDAVAVASANQARVVVFPECALTGYCYEDFDEAERHAQSSDGPAVAQMSAACARGNCTAVFGFLESADDTIYNAAALVGPDGLIAVYRKVHLPDLGVDKLVTAGDRPFAVHTAAGVRTGINICYDSAFPEAARTLALRGADLIALPTNFPHGAECMIQHVVHARAMENQVYFLVVNRVGEERGFRFLGQSKLCAPNGSLLAEAGEYEETILYGDVDPEWARNKHVVRVPGKHEINRFADRRPELYGALVEPNQWTRNERG